MRRRAIGWLIALTLTHWPLCVSATPAGCLALAAETEANLAIPAGVLQAIALTESGAWPWILNAGGEPYVLETRRQATAAAYAAMLQFGDEVAIGCMQIHMRWHRHAFTTIDEVLDPGTNVHYAGEFLVSLRRTYGTWVDAVRHYNASDPDAQDDYLCRVLRQRVSLGYQATTPGMRGFCTGGAP